MTIKIKKSRRLKKILDGKLIKDLAKKNIMIQAGQLCADIIYRRTKKGAGVTNHKSPNPSSEKLKALSTKYIKYRKKYPPKGAFASPSKSNLTYTGQMLDSIKDKSVTGKIKLTLGGRRSKSKLTNKEVGEHVQNNGRPFFALSVKEQKVLYKFLKEKLSELVSQLKK